MLWRQKIWVHTYSDVSWNITDKKKHSFDYNL